MSSTSETILLTGVGGPAGRSLCRQLRALNPHLRIIATDIREVEAPVDAFIIGPRADSPEHIPFLQSLITEYTVDFFIPTVQDELPVIASAMERLDAQVIMSNPRAVTICHDKLLTALYLEAAGVNVPETSTGAHTPLSYPLVVKPRVSRGGRGVAVVDTPEELPYLDDSLITQEFASGTEYCPQVYRSPLSGTVTTVILEKTELREGRVGNAAAVLRLDRKQAEDIAELAEATTRALDLHGPIDMDIRRDATGTPMVLEINARFGANSVHAPEMLSNLLADLKDLSRPGLQQVVRQ